MADVRLTAINPEDSSVVPVTCDASGRLLLEERGVGPQGPPGPEGPPGEDGQDGKDGDPFSGTFAGNVTFEGTASFDDHVIVDQYLTITNTSLSSNAKVQIQGDNDVALSVYPIPAGNRTIELFHDGSASFDGYITSDSGYKVTNVAVEFSGVGGATSNYLWMGSSPSAKDIKFYTTTGLDGIASGSADFAGRLQVGHNGVPKAIIKPNGSVSFADNKAGFTAEGYLWCTTRRGDTVILDATSNGLATWNEYIPPASRKQQIKEKLDSLREETGEMPADTQ